MENNENLKQDQEQAKVEQEAPQTTSNRLPSVLAHRADVFSLKLQLLNGYYTSELGSDTQKQQSY